MLLVLASGDGKRNEFGTSFLEVVDEVLSHKQYVGVRVRLASFDWRYPEDAEIRPPTNGKLRKIVESSDRGEFINLMDHYDSLVFHERAP
jgi:hypothetical protein